MRRVDWDSDDRSFRLWGVCVVGASLFWIVYWILGPGATPGGGRVPFRTIAWSLSAPVAMIGIYVFQLGRRQAKRRRERR